MVCVFVLQVIAAPASSAHKQLKTSSFKLGKNVFLFQQQRSSNLCGLCALNNATCSVSHTPGQFDKSADQLWLDALQRMGGLKVQLPPTRLRDGKIKTVIEENTSADYTDDDMVGVAKYLAMVTITIIIQINHCS